jgi:hypothetical protein
MAVLSLVGSSVALGQAGQVPPLDQTREDAASTLLTVGATSLGLAYGASVLAAATSQHTPDRWLYVPLLGPYLDLGDREACGFSAARPCYREAGNKLLLATDGIIQTVGTAAIIFAAVKPAHAAQERSLQLGLVQLRRGQPGLAAFGRF